MSAFFVFSASVHCIMALLSFAVSISYVLFIVVFSSFYCCTFVGILLWSFDLYFGHERCCDSFFNVLPLQRNKYFR